MPAESVRYTMGAAFEQLTLKTPERLLFGHSFRSIQGPFVRPYHPLLLRADEEEDEVGVR